MLVVGARRQQRAHFGQRRTDRAVGRVELGIDHAALAAEPAPVLAILAIAHHGELGLDAMGLAQREVVLAMVGRHVDQAGAAFGGDEIAREQRARLGKEAAQRVHRVAGDGAGEVRALASHSGAASSTP
jgi:hypothetical protein